MADVASSDPGVEKRYDAETGMPLFGEPDWTTIAVERATMRTLQRRSDLPGLLRFGSYLGLLVAFAALTVLVHPLWAKVVFFLMYSVVYAFSEAILHETHHRTPFRTLWLNEVAHHISGLFAFKEPLRDRWLHAGHHTYTYYSEIDPEIATERPPHFWTLIFDFLRIHNALIKWLWPTVRTAVVGLDELTCRWVPRDYRRQLVWSARGCVAFYLAVIALAVAIPSWYPILLIFVARFVGAPLHSWVTFIQHAGLEENVPDWRENTRTVHMNPLFRLLYWNMNYHVEHHMHPTVPFHALARLHGEIEAQTPPAYPSTLAAWNEMIRALWRQRREPAYSVHRPLPERTPTDAGQASGVGAG
jgi:fatty acid desaturase